MTQFINNKVPAFPDNLLLNYLRLLFKVIKLVSCIKDNKRWIFLHILMLFTVYSIFQKFLWVTKFIAINHPSFINIKMRQKYET